MGPMLNRKNFADTGSELLQEGFVQPHFRRAALLLSPD